MPTPILPTTQDALEKAESCTYGTENPGWCTTCGDWTHDGCEPEATRYECDECGKRTVYAAEMLLVMGLTSDASEVTAKAHPHDTYNPDCTLKDPDTDNHL